MSKQIGTQLIHSAQSDANQAFHQSKLNELHEKIEKVHQGGGLKALQKHKSKNKLTANYWACKNLWTKGGSRQPCPSNRRCKYSRRAPILRSRSRRR